MKTEVYIYNLNGNRAAVRDYAKTIAEMSETSSNAYVMAFDKNNEILWTVQADNLESVNKVINWQGVRRVEIYDHSANGTYKVEYVYVTSQKSLTGYTSERDAFDFIVVENNTQFIADNWKKDNTLNMLRAAAKEVECLTEANEHTAALLAKLSVLDSIGLSVRSLIDRTKAIEVAHQRGYLTPDEVAERYQISQETERRAALFLTPEEFRALYRHDPQTDSKIA